MLTESNLNMSLGGGGGSVESIVQALGLSKFDKFFPYLAVCKNAVLDILWISPIYKEITFSKRVALAKACSSAIYKRFNVKEEFHNSYKTYFKSFFRKAL